MTPEKRLDLQLDRQPWSAVKRGAAPGEWTTIITPNGVVLGEFVSELHATRTVITHNDWLYRINDGVSYRKGFWWAMVGASAGALAGIIRAGVDTAPWTWTIGAAGVASAMFCMGMAVTRFRNSE